MKKIKAIFVCSLLALVLLSNIPANAADYTWLGINSDWMDPQNWSSPESPGGIPTSADNVIINVIPPMVDPLISGQAEVANFTFTSGTLTISPSVSFFIHGAANMSGTVKIAGTTASLSIGTSAPSETVTIGTETGTILIEPVLSVYALNATLQHVTLRATSLVAAGISITGCTFNGITDFRTTGDTQSIVDGPFSCSATFALSNEGTGSVIFGNVNSNSFLFSASATFSNTGEGSIVFGNAPDNDIFIFNNTSSFTNNSGTGSILFGNSVSDAFTFTGAATFTKSSTGPIEVARYGTTDFFNTLTYDATGTEINTFGNAGGGLCNFKGGIAQIIRGTGGGLNFNKITISKTANHVTLQTPVNLIAIAEAAQPDPQLNLLSGNIITTNNTTPARILTVQDGLVITQNADPNKSFVSGPMRKTGITAFTFPVGKATIYHPITIGAATPESPVTILAEYFNVAPPLSTAAVNLSPDIITMSSCEYWQLSKISGTSDVAATLAWPLINCETIQTVGLKFARYNTVTKKWEALPATINDTERKLTANAPLITYGNIALGFSSKRIYVDTRGLDPVNFSITGAQLTEGIIYGGNKLIPLMPVMPVSGTSTITVDIAGGNENDAMKITFDIDNTSAISNVKASLDNSPAVRSLENDFYSINNTPANGKTIKFLRGDEVVAPIFTTNLVDGTVLNNSSGGTFQISGLTGYTISSFSIFSLQDQLIKGPLTIATWDGTDQSNSEVSNGVYKFELVITNTAQSYTYKGQVIVK